MSNPARHALLEECRSAVAASDYAADTWLLAGSMGRAEDIWLGEAPVSDIDLVVVVEEFRPSRVEGFTEITSRIREKNPYSGVDVKQIRRSALAEMARTLFVRDLVAAPLLLGGARPPVPAVPPTIASACFLIANRYTTWISHCTESRLTGNAEEWSNLLARHRTCDLVLAAATGCLVAAGRYRISLQERVREFAALSNSPVAREAYEIRRQPEFTGEPAGELWRRWAPDVLSLLEHTLGPVPDWPAEAGADGVQSLPPSGKGTPAAAKGALQASAVLLAHCWSDVDLAGELDKVAGEELPGWAGSWSRSREALTAFWRRTREAGE
ncbi:MAG TPA: hypothetical protein VHC49_13865 [Mycobacteriales bacterium]|nr:hypothetical protein [Mycobacteriales bacterium]